MAKKPMTRAERVEVIYNEKHWEMLRELRSKTIQIMEVLDRSHIPSIVHGSIARGDISEKSDIDVFLPDPPSSFTIETALERAHIPANRRIVVQATPFYAVKGYIELDEQRCVSFPLVKLRHVERDFYRFSGEASLPTLKKDTRVSGVDKRLMLIEPTLRGHTESSIVGREETVAHILGVSLNTVLDRVHALLRRDEVGRTGVFIERELSPDETFEMVLKKLADQNPAVRRRLKLYGK
ncbi:MAG: DNA polymerase subunit beta [Candidatus Bathyarchaeota archaeon]|nr:DNA polymerase subunit beta [Candidatus Bathyarchaeota archaeon]MDH5532135.1 DNA polymerase subunit beta [Candidatus Bathyarchaeota archaeon]